MPDPSGVDPLGAVPRLDPVAVEQLRVALEDARRVLAHVLDERAGRDHLLVGWQGGHRVRRDRAEQDVTSLGRDLDGALRQQRERLDDEVARLRALRVARGGAAPRRGWSARVRLPCLLGR